MKVVGILRSQTHKNIIMAETKKVSVHGGHSGEFCNHATDTLEEMILAYIEKGFSWVGITEHAPGLSEELLYPDQREAGFTPEFLLERFGRYMRECRRLQTKYKDRLKIYAAMEIETYTGYEEFVPYLVETFSPDYLVGSVHFVNDLNFDYSQEMYNQVARSVGGIEQMYLDYFDLQYDMLKRFKPAVVGHFDLVRIFDRNYRDRLELPEIAEKVKRNLQLIRDLELIMDFNLRALYKGAEEPYIAEPILKAARDYGISVVPGDDSHSISTVGNFIEEGITILRQTGFSAQWRSPLA